MKPHSLLAIILAAATITSCTNNNQPSEEHHEHEENLQLTAYNNDFELYAEAKPFVANQPSEILAHFTTLNNFKPLKSAKITATLSIGNDSISQSLDAPSSPGIFKFSLTPTKTGKANLRFYIQTTDSSSLITTPEITVYSDEHDAHQAAEEAEISSSNSVSFTKEMSWKIDFSTELCRQEPFGEIIKTMAQVQPSQGDECIISAKTSGIVSISDPSLIVGTSVSNNQPLFSIKSSDMADDNLSVRLREAESEYSIAKKDYERKSELAKDNIVSESDLLSARARFESAEAVYSNLQRNFSSGAQSVTAPISGFVKQLLVRNGQFVEAGQPLISISQNKDLFLKADIQPKYYHSLSYIADANIRLLNSDSVFSLKSLNGRLISYGKSVESGSPLIPVIFSINNSLDLLPGSFIELYIKTLSAQPSLTVPNVSLVEEMGNYFVFVQLTPELFEKREVKIGKSDGLRTEILSGIVASERIVAKGATLVKLAQATGSLDAESGHHH